MTDSGEKKEETEFHRLVAWNKLAELCSQLLFKGRRIYTEGRLQTRHWTGQDGMPRQTTEVVIDEMMILDSKRAPGEGEEPVPEEPEAMKEEAPEAAESAAAPVLQPASKTSKKSTKVKDKKKKEEIPEEKKEDDQVKPEDIPF